MIIELRGVEFVNKGAELMLHAIVQKIRERFPDAIIAMELTGRVRKENLAKNDLYTKKGRRAWLLPKFVRRRMRLVIEKEIDVVLDGSGFAFGDQWGVHKAKVKLGLKVGGWHRKGKKIILLPQAFGPFSDEALKTVMKEIIANTHLVFAREAQSYSYLKSVADSSVIKLAPDFTNLLKGKVPENFIAAEMQVPVIPNAKMIEKNADSAHYVSFLQAAINKIISCGLKPYFLIHEGEPDIKIAQTVNGLLPVPLHVVINPDPIALKGIISTAYFIVCSRFHGVVSALSQGVPCISTSWSHKYAMLHQDYGFEEGLIQDIKNNSELEEKIAMLADPERNREISEKLIRCSVQQKEKSAQMWEAVFESM